MLDLGAWASLHPQPGAIPSHETRGNYPSDGGSRIALFVDAGLFRMNLYALPGCWIVCMAV